MIAPEVPVIVSVLLPRAAVELAERVRIASYCVVTGLGENEAVTPLGRPETERVTLPLNPYAGVI